MDANRYNLSHHYASRSVSTQRAGSTESVVPRALTPLTHLLLDLEGAATHAMDPAVTLASPAVVDSHLVRDKEGGGERKRRPHAHSSPPAASIVCHFVSAVSM